MSMVGLKLSTAMSNTELGSLRTYRTLFVTFYWAVSASAYLTPTLIFDGLKPGAECCHRWQRFQIS